MTKEYRNKVRSSLATTAFWALKGLPNIPYPNDYDKNPVDAVKSLQLSALHWFDHCMVLTGEIHRLLKAQFKLRQKHSRVVRNYRRLKRELRKIESER